MEIPDIERICIIIFENCFLISSISEFKVVEFFQKQTETVGFSG